MADQSRSRIHASAPFGAVGRRLGWRWAFPIGTMPVPYHPLLLPLLLAGLAAWMVMRPAWRAIETGSIGPLAASWPAPFAVAGLLGILLSVPLLQWFFYMLRLHLVQALLVPFGMVLLALSAATEQRFGPAFAVPALFFGWHLAASLWGRWLLARLARENERTAAQRPLATGDPLLIRPAPTARDPGPSCEGQVLRLLETLDTPVLHYRSRGSAKAKAVNGSLWRLRREDREALKGLIADVPGIQISSRGGKDSFAVVRVAEDAPPPATIEIDLGPWKGPRLLGFQTFRSELQRIRIVPPDGPALFYVHGKAAPYRWLPGFAAFRHFALVGRSNWQLGFIPARARQLGPSEGAAALRILSGRAPGEAPTRFADPATLRALLEARREALIAEELERLDRLLAAPAGPERGPFKLLQREPSRWRDRLERIWPVLESARDEKLHHIVYPLAGLIAALPPEDFAAAGSRILKLLNSKQVAFQQPIKVTSADIRAGRKFPFRGFGLLRSVPRLYERLGDLGERARPLVKALGDAADWPEPLVKAMERLDGASD